MLSGISAKTFPPGVTQTWRIDCGTLLAKIVVVQYILLSASTLEKTIFSTLIPLFEVGNLISMSLGRVVVVTMVVVLVVTGGIVVVEVEGMLTDVVVSLLGLGGTKLIRTAIPVRTRKTMANNMGHFGWGRAAYPLMTVIFV